MFWNYSGLIFVGVLGVGVLLNSTWLMNWCRRKPFSQIGSLIVDCSLSSLQYRFGWGRSSLSDCCCAGSWKSALPRVSLDIALWRTRSFRGNKKWGACEEEKTVHAGRRGTKLALDQKNVRSKKREKQKTQAVASFETRMRVVASIEVLSTPGGWGCYICQGLAGPCVVSYDL